MIFIAASRSLALMSGILSSAIRRNCSRVTLPTLSRLGVAEPFSMPASLRNNTAAGGVLVMNVKLRSA